ncbi:MAG: NAD(P)-dependent glycerol-1-phosphate dehydrogenase [Candidatus Heimdallarchaeota archaeon]|nr:NAD(P)-dependent glycerol-1-phosphate dehydrogenase [Candidatus Heimdallarchaeota archaeon]MCK5047812.1 NAD(P)-dependent glycerol-1-phosphate dehydrogenase [Candidatus Heimdallarchaeota archaeon]
MEKTSENEWIFKTVELPRMISVGNNLIDQAGKIMNKANLGKTGVLIADPITIKIAGETTIDSLEKSNFEMTQHLISSASIGESHEVEKVIKEYEADFAVAVGGGAVIDVTKYGSFLANVPFVSVPTVASHDGIASSRASLHKDNKKHSFTAHTPAIVIGDTSIINNAPFKFTLSGCGDVISNLTAVLDWELSHRLKGEAISSYASHLSRLTAQMVIEHRKEVYKGSPSVSDLVLKALVTSSMAMCIAGSSRPASGAEHMFSHALDELSASPALHGEQCGVGAILMMYLHNGDWKLIKDTLEEIGAPTTAKEMGIPDKDIITALTTAHTIRDRYTILGDTGLSQKAAEKLATKTGVID